LEDDSNRKFKAMEKKNKEDMENALVAHTNEVKELNSASESMRK